MLDLQLEMAKFRKTQVEMQHVIKRTTNLTKEFDAINISLRDQRDSLLKETYKTSDMERDLSALIEKNSATIRSHDNKFADV